MSKWADEWAQAPEAPQLQRVRSISRPLAFLVSVALFLCSLAFLLALASLLLPPRSSPGSCVVIGTGVALINVGPIQRVGAACIPLAQLSAGQRQLIAAHFSLCLTCLCLMLLQLRALFGLYSRGIIFAAENAQRIKQFALWLVVLSVVVNLSGRITAAVIHAPPTPFGLGISSFTSTLVAGTMIYVIGYVMELGREADLERRDFV
jgi:Protein of unknown function (DUF2975)